MNLFLISTGLDYPSYSFGFSFGISSTNIYDSSCWILLLLLLLLLFPILLQPSTSLQFFGGLRFWPQRHRELPLRLGTNVWEQHWNDIEIRQKIGLQSVRASKREWSRWRQKGVGGEVEGFLWQRKWGGLKWDNEVHRDNEMARD